MPYIFKKATSLGKKKTNKIILLQKFSKDTNISIFLDVDMLTI